MPRKRLRLPKGSENKTVDCFAFRAEMGGEPDCIALRDIYCLKEDKPCPFHATPEDAELSRMHAALRLSQIAARIAKY